MDRNTVIGFILIGIVLMVWMMLNAPPPQQYTAPPDSLGHSFEQVSPETSQVKEEPMELKTEARDTLGKYFSHLATGEAKVLTIETKLYRAEITTIGGAIKSWVLKNYKTWDQYPVDLINTSQGGELHSMFFTSDGKLIETKRLLFISKFENGEVISLQNGDSITIDLTLKIDDRSSIIKSLTFYDGLYSFDVSYKFEDMEDIISNFEYQVIWESGLRYMEHNSINESNSAMAYAFAGGELTEIDASSFDEEVKQTISGRVTWVANRNKYFAVAIIPRGKESRGAFLGGNRMRLPDKGAKENYMLSLKMPFIGNSEESDHFTVFLGPLDFDIVKQYHVELEQIMSLGAAWIIRPISEYVIIPLFRLLRSIIPNYGFVLIVFSFIVKIALYPLTKSSMKSMQRMQALQPMMNEIREKYKDDPQKMNQQIMRLYREYGVNPAGGCLPMIFQLPILYALWAVFSSAIELRQASFILWIQDLSIPDVVATLPFRIPIFNINELSGLALLMGITMFIQQKMSVKDPRQKMMVWIMPLFLTLMFNGFPSGLNLYYFVFNLLSIAQQTWINKQHKGEPLRKVEVKKKSGGILTRITKDLPRARR